MKKVLLAIMMVLVFSGSAHALTAVTQAAPCKSIENTDLYECTYEVPTVADTAVTEHSLVIDSTSGQIVELIVNNLSSDFNYWFAKSAGQDRTTPALTKDVFIFYETRNLNHSPDLGNGRSFINRDDAKLIYFWMDNDDGGGQETEISYVSVTFRR